MQFGLRESMKVIVGRVEPDEAYIGTDRWEPPHGMWQRQRQRR